MTEKFKNFKILPTPVFWFKMRFYHELNEKHDRVVLMEKMFEIYSRRFRGIKRVGGREGANLS